MDGIHWQAFWPEYHTQGGKDHIARMIDLDAGWQKYLEGEGKWWFSPTPDERKAEYRAALDSVQAFRDAEKRHHDASGMTAADERSEQLSDALSAARERLMTTPAPDLAALRWKLDYLTDGGKGWEAWSDDFTRQTLADIVRLLPAEA